MGIIGTLFSFVSGQKIQSSQVNQNFTDIKSAFNTYGVLTDTAKTITAAHTFTGRETFSGGADVTTLRVNGPVFDITHPFYGAVGDGVTDDSAALNAALAAAYTAGGGTVVCPKLHLINSQITIPNDGAAIPRQPAIRITGMATGNQAGQTTTVPASIGVLDFRYNGTTAKILTLGLGTLELDHLYIKDGGTSALPFILTTNTTVKAHHNRVDGNTAKALTTCDQDFIVLGGLTKVSDGTVTAPFQGYGTVITDNCFNHIRRGVYGRTFANACIVRDNWFLHQCGSNLAGGAAIEFLGLVTDACTGNVVIGNQIEVGGYPYPLKETYGARNMWAFNSCFDATATTLACHRIETASSYATIIPGYQSGKPGVSDLAATGDYTIVTAEQSAQSRFPGGLYSGAGFASLTRGLEVTDSAGNLWDESSAVESTFPTRTFRNTPFGGASSDVVKFRSVSATDKRIMLRGTDSRVDSLGDLRLYAVAGNTTWLGDASKQFQITNGILATSLAAGSQMFNLAGKINTVSGTRGGSEALRTELAALATAGLITDSSVSGNTAVPYSASMTIDASTTHVATITVTNGTAFTINAPTNPQTGMALRLRIRNTSGGVVGTMTLNAVFKAQSGFISPTTGFSRTIDFDYDGTNWVESNRSASDIAN